LFFQAVQYFFFDSGEKDSPGADCVWSAKR